nr:hypothetical protein [Tanacetum cinerariifolium]
NNSHDGYDYQQQFLFVYEQELSYNQNYDEASEKQKQSVEDTMLELVKICQEKEFFCIRDDVDDLIEIAPILSTKEPKHLLSMGYEHLSITPETESDQVTESYAENLLPIPNKSFPIFTTFSNLLFNNDNLDFSDDESLPEEDVPAEDFKIYSNPLFDEDEINSDKLDSHYDVLPLSNENDDDLSNDSLLEEVDLFLAFDNSIPPGIENIADDPVGDIRFLEELLIDDSILSYESFDSNFEDNP